MQKGGQANRQHAERLILTSPPSPVPPLSLNAARGRRAATLVCRLEWSRRPSRAASHSHRAAHCPVTDARRASRSLPSLPPSQPLQRHWDVLAELRGGQSVRRRSTGNASAAEVRDTGGRGFTLWVRLWPDHSSLPGNRKTGKGRHNKNSTAVNKII